MASCYFKSSLLLPLIGLLIACGGSSTASETSTEILPKTEATAAFALTSPDLKTGTIPNEHVFNSFGCQGGNLSPALSWTNAPEGTKSFAITVYDADAPTGSGWWHWVAFNIPASTTGVARGGALPEGTIQSVTDFGGHSYGGPCPPNGRTHTYRFTVHALNIETLGTGPDFQLDANTMPAMVGYFLNGNSLGTASISATYTREGSEAVSAQKPTLTVSSPELQSGTIEQAQVFNSFGCTGQNTAPSLSWTAGPEGTKSYAITAYDPDAPTGSGWWHWIAFNIPANVTSLAAGATLPAGAIESKTSYGAPGYGGPCPPAGEAHDYIFTVWALPEETLGLGPDAQWGADSMPALIGYTLNGISLASGTIKARYHRPQ
ncbi:MAG: YbhB/YbcL family Raf kinase inhibitor-like protein [Myxococcota bacterium]|nr:YbhB/YbcL family Raf kinase inhibitor-like protein [Myxococcota bacterium]